MICTGLCISWASDYNRAVMVSLQKVCVLKWSMHVLGSEYGSVVTAVVLLQRVCVVQPGEHDV